jgi:hypothetical protein
LVTPLASGEDLRRKTGIFKPNAALGIKNADFVPSE